MLDRLQKEDLDPFLNEIFRLSTEEGPSFEVKLVEVTATAGTVGQRQPFSAVFAGPEDPILPQAIYTLEHEKMGPLDLFIVPLGPSENGIEYEAVFT